MARALTFRAVGAETFVCRPTVVIVALHLPTLQIELAACATIEAGAIGLALKRQWATHLFVPAAKHPGYEAADAADPERRIC